MSRLLTPVLVMLAALSFTDGSAHETAAARTLDPAVKGGSKDLTDVSVGRSTITASQFEIVATREGADVLLYIDDYASNAPVAGVQVDLHQAGRNLRAEPTGDGRYRLPADVLDTTRPITLSVSGIEQSISIELSETASLNKSAPDEHRGLHWAFSGATGMLIVIGALLGFVVLVGRQRRRTESLSP